MRINIHHEFFRALSLVLDTILTIHSAACSDLTTRRVSYGCYDSGSPTVLHTQERPITVLQLWVGNFVPGKKSSGPSSSEDSSLLNLRPGYETRTVRTIPVRATAATRMLGPSRELTPSSRSVYHERESTTACHTVVSAYNITHGNGKSPWLSTHRDQHMYSVSPDETGPITSPLLFLFLR
jgi:hypothetical protein